MEPFGAVRGAAGAVTRTVDPVRGGRVRLALTGTRARSVLLTSLCLVLAGSAGACQAPSDGGGEASCAAVIELDGHTYWGRGGLDRIPPTTGEALPAVVPGCDDSGGQDEPVRDESVQVQVLDGVEPRVAVLYHDTLYLREGESLPEETAAWFRASRCTTEGEFELTADWLGVRSSRKTRFDGDVRLPYRMMVRVTEGPAPYVGGKVTLRASAPTGPTLTPEDVKSSLWEGGRVEATVRCEEGRFVLVAVRPLPPA